MSKIFPAPVFYDTLPLAALQEDIHPGLLWAEKAFGCPPEAVNLWVGGAGSVTSFHKDHYENMFAVITGTKTFHLLPPSDVYRLAAREFPLAQYYPTDAGVFLEPSLLTVHCPVPSVSRFVMWVIRVGTCIFLGVLFQSIRLTARFCRTPDQEKNLRKGESCERISRPPEIPPATRDLAYTWSPIHPAVCNLHRWCS